MLCEPQRHSASSPRPQLWQLRLEWNHLKPRGQRGHLRQVSSRLLPTKPPVLPLPCLDKPAQARRGQTSAIRVSNRGTHRNVCRLASRFPRNSERASKRFGPNATRQGLRRQCAFHMTEVLRTRWQSRPTRRPPTVATPAGAPLPHVMLSLPLLSSPSCADCSNPPADRLVA